jgi:hypothetical protein
LPSISIPGNILKKGRALSLYFTLGLMGAPSTEEAGIPSLQWMELLEEFD